MSLDRNDLSEASVRPGNGKLVRAVYRFNIWSLEPCFPLALLGGVFASAFGVVAGTQTGLAEAVLVAASGGGGILFLSSLAGPLVWKRARRRGSVLDNRHLPKKDRVLLARLEVTVPDRQEAAAKCGGLLPVEPDSPDGLFQRVLWDAADLLHRTVRLEKESIVNGQVPQDVAAVAAAARDSVLAVVVAQEQETERVAGLAREIAARDGDRNVRLMEVAAAAEAIRAVESLPALPIGTFAEHTRRALAAQPRTP